MLVVVRDDASAAERARLTRLLEARSARGSTRTLATPARHVIRVEGIAPDSRVWAEVAALPAVERLVPSTTPYPLASRALSPLPTVVRVGEVRIGGSEPVIIAGPCSVESEEQIVAAAHAVRAAGAGLLRGGAFKPRTSPYSFQGLGLPGVELLARAGRMAGLPIVTEVMEPGLVPAVAELADVLQVGSRNMQNFPLLRAVGRTRRPVLLKRGFAATIEEWLLAAEYILAEGNAQVILCERGVRGFDPQTRNLLDLACIPLLRELTHLPVIVDPSHATGRRDLVPAMGVAAIAAGADGLIVEMHPHPDEALSDGEQTIDSPTLARLVRRCRAVRAALAEETAEEHGEASEALVSGASR